MILPQTENTRVRLRSALFLGAAAVQAVCLVMFVIDVSSELSNPDRMTAAEGIGVVGLALSIVFILREYRDLLHRNSRVERKLDAATGAFANLMDDQFRRWGLTSAKRDVALMSVKGVSVGDIAALRQTAPGTVKAQSAAIYRKAGVSNRAEMISVLIEDLIDGVPLP